MRFSLFGLPISLFTRADRYYTGETAKVPVYHDYFNSKTGFVMFITAVLVITSYFGVLVDLMFDGADDRFSS